MSAILARIHDEPVAFYAVVRAVVVLAVSFGLRLEPEQIGAIYLTVEAILSFLTRRKVTPV